MRIVHVTRERRAAFEARIAELEAIASYPLGDDRFRIDHGASYFAFFDRLGEVETLVATEGERVVAVASGVLRRVPLRAGEPREPAWYLCDLKVHPDARGRGIPFRMLAEGFPASLDRARRHYLVSMDPPGGAPNRVARMLQRIRAAPFAFGARLEIHSLDETSLCRVIPLLARERGAVRFLSLRGTKDLVLASTGRPMPLLHVQLGDVDPVDLATCVGAPQRGHTHMLCVPEGDALAGGLRARGLSPSATASILHREMDGSDWRFLRTSDI